MRKLITKGSLVLANGVKAKVIGFDKLKGAHLEERDTGRQFHLPTDDVTAIEASGEVADYVDTVRALWFDEKINDAHRKKANDRKEVVEQYILKKISKKKAAKELNLSESQLGRIIKRYRPEIGAASLLGQTRGRKAGSVFLSPVVEQLITECIDEFYEGEAASLQRVYLEVDTKCVLSGHKTPSKNAVNKRLQALGPEELFRRKHGAEAANQRFGLKPGVKKVSRALEFVQIDHTMVDIFIRDEAGVLVMRPWITMLVDLSTRIVLGYYITLCTPSAISCAMAIVNAVLPKTKMLSALGDPDIKLTAYGLMQFLHSDNAAEFKSDDYVAACDFHDIKVTYRPVGAKHFGGHIERLIGTFMGKVHFLKGSTQSNIFKRGSIDPAKHASMTLKEFELWFARNVAIYNDTVHSSLQGRTPQEAWDEDFSSSTGNPIMPPTVADPRAFALDFYPSARRVVGRKGVEFKGRFFCDKSTMRGLVTKKIYFKYDPRELNRIFYKPKDRYVDIGLADKSLDVISENQYNLRDPAKYGRAGRLRNKVSHELRAKNHELEKQSQKNARRAAKARKANEVHREKTQAVIGAMDEPMSSPSESKPIDTRRVRHKLKWED